MLDLFLNAALIILISVTIIWIISVIITDASIVDLFWGLGFVIINGSYFFLSDDIYLRNKILLILVSTWGIRLFLYLTRRNLGKGEDFRYQEFRRKYGAHRYWWVSYFQTFLLQGVLMLLISMPLLGTHNATNSNGLNFLDALAILIWIVGFSFEAGGDYQLEKFKKNPQNKGKVLDKGFWKYTRHPNYFGDAAVWWAYGLFSAASGSYWPIIGSVIMTLLIIKVSGVALLEKTLKQTKPQYKEYILKTNAFLPWFPKKIK